jgi:hypothetical protein
MAGLATARRAGLATFALLLSGAISGTALATDTDAQFHPGELLADKEHRRAWQQVVEAEERLPEWILNLSGASQPARALKADGKDYLVARVCEAARCLQQQLHVVFSINKDDAYALWAQVPDALPADKAPSQHASLRWLGEPDENVRQLLVEQLKASPGWY